MFFVSVHAFFVLICRYGYSEGSPTEEGVYTDAEAALDFLLENKTVNNRDIFVFGRSIGGAVAIELARRRSDEVHSPRDPPLITLRINMLLYATRLLLVLEGLNSQHDYATVLFYKIASL